MIREKNDIEIYSLIIKEKLLLLKDLLEPWKIKFTNNIKISKNINIIKCLYCQINLNIE